MSNSASPSQLIVCGFHRSGTSLTMQALKNAGLFVGGNLMQAHPSNPDGHFENRQIVSLHDEMLLATQRYWHSTGGPVTSIDGRFATRANNIISRYCEQSSVWGFKDPRTCLFLDWWKSLLPNAGAVLIYRNYLASYQSLRNREAQILAFNPAGSLLFWHDPHLGLRLWLDYNQALLAYAQSNRDTTILVSCEAMMSGYDLVESVNKKFNLSLDPHSESGIRVTSHIKNHYQSVCSPIPDKLLCDLSVTLKALNELADSPGSIEPTLLPPAKFDPTGDKRQTQSVFNELGISVQGRQKTASVKLVEQPVGDPVDQGQEPAGSDADSLLLQIESITRQKPAVDDSQFIRHCVAAFPDNLKIRIAAGRYFLDRSQYTDAAAQFSYCHQHDPKNPVSLLNLGFLENNQRHYLKAAHYFKLACNLQPHNPILFFHLSKALISAQRFESALYHCEQGLLVDPDHAKLMTLKIKMLIQSESIGKAEEFCKKAINRQPEEPEFYSLYAEIESLQGNPREALQSFYLSAWKKIKTLPDYRDQLNCAINDVPLQIESWALRRQVNTELQSLSKKVRMHRSVAAGE